MTRPRTPSYHKNTARVFHALGQPSRLKILAAIGEGEACVCHLEAALGMRQAYISQQLMALRQEGLVDARRDGRNVYYHLADPALLELVRQAARLAGCAEEVVEWGRPGQAVEGCPCPHCAGKEEGSLICTDGREGGNR